MNQPRRKSRSVAVLKIVLVGLAFWLFFMLTAGVPEFAQLCRDHGKLVPTPVALLDSVGVFLRSYGWILLGALVAIAFYSRHVTGTFICIESRKALGLLCTLLIAALAFTVYAIMQPILDVGEI